LRVGLHRKRVDWVLDADRLRVLPLLAPALLSTPFLHLRTFLGQKQSRLPTHPKPTDFTVIDFSCLLMDSYWTLQQSRLRDR
jgi:hypothetical protein